MKRGYKDPRTAESVQIFKGDSRESTYRRFGPNFRGKAGIHGPPNQSEFWIWDTMINGPPNRSKCLKRKVVIYGRPIWSEFLKGDVGIHGPPIWAKFLKRRQRSADRLFGSIFRGICGDPRTAELVRILKTGSRDPRTAESVRSSSELLFFKLLESSGSWLKR